MKKPRFLAGIISFVLVFGLIVTGCEQSTSNTGGGGSTTQYTITFNASGGTVSPSSLQVNSGETVPYLPVPTRAGYTFEGWYTGSNGSGSQFTADTPVTSNRTVYAKWTSQGGNGGSEETNGGNTVTRPGVPTGVTATALSSSSIRISWNTVSGATSYKVFWALSADGTYLSFATPKTASQTASSLSASTTYYFKVKSVNSAGDESDYSSPAAYATTLTSAGGGETAKPVAPTEPTAIAYSSSSIYITWNEVSGATSYKIYCAASASGTYALKGTVNSPSRSYTITGLSPSTTYYIKVSAVNSAGESAMSPYTYETTLSSGGGETGKPSAPTGVTATALSSSSIKVSWNAVSGATSYKVYYDRSASGSYNTLDGTVTAPTTSYTSTGWNPGTTGYFKVTAVNSAGESPQSSYDSATTLSSGGGTSYGSITIVNNSNRTIGSLTLYGNGGYNLFNRGLDNITITSGASRTFTNIPTGTYYSGTGNTLVGASYPTGHHINKSGSYTVSSGQTLTITITNSDWSD